MLECTGAVCAACYYGSVVHRAPVKRVRWLADGARAHTANLKKMKIKHMTTYTYIHSFMDSQSAL